MAHADISDMEGFELGKPALVCRWRLAHRKLPLENRHMRALAARTANGTRVTPELVAWAKQHIEWTLDEGSVEHPDGVLMLIVDEQGRAAMTVGPYIPLEDTTVRGLARRSKRAADEAFQTGVAPEALWAVRDDELIWDFVDGSTPSGASSLVAQLAQTLGFRMRRREGLADEVLAGTVLLDEALLVSDEHGIVVAEDAAGKHGVRFADGYKRLMEKQ